MGKGIDEYISSHNRVQHAAWIEFLTWRYDGEDRNALSSDRHRTQYGDDDIPSAVTPEMEEYLEGGYSSPESSQGTPGVPYSSPLMREMTRRFYEQANKKRTPEEQFEIDANKAAMAQRMCKEL